MQVLKRRWDISPPHLWVSGRLVLRWLGQRGWVRGGESVSQLSVEFFIECPFTFFFFFRNFVIRHGRLSFCSKNTGVVRLVPHPLPAPIHARTRLVPQLSPAPLHRHPT